MFFSIAKRKIERKAQSEQHDRMIEVVANNNAIVRQNSTVIERNKDINDGVIDKSNLIEKGIGELHSLVTEHTSSTEEIYARLVKEIDQLKKSSNIKA